ncbi:uncharacterized protein UHO2_04151 [Ustilago hordei]|uniref:CCHC-type domain-containing protein n=1 Tax=Ustilago hordei TaxID=120017 RepID=I2FWP0_USTHO|nr:uncharacterized protein UHO2_04151 [Ustilago hordei]CCF51333.1 uncharacterized protein UHOR_05280 [Ustilago hordei]SYW79508.1 uncharacterized protein UHO2_04151 [Ustilago hordei]
MPPQTCNSDTESSNLSDGPNKAKAPTMSQRQMLIGAETPLPYNSDDIDNNSDETHYNIDTISNLNPEMLKGMLIKLTKCNKAKDSDAYKKPSHHSNFHQRLLHTHDTLKEAPKLMTKNWYSWNPCFRAVLSNWPAAMKHLNGTVAPGDKNLYCKLKKDLTKMEKIAKSTLLNKVGKIHMFQANICKLIADINEHWAKAESMGHALPKILKVKMLIDQARYITPYHHCIITLEDTGMASSYEVLCAALCKQQDSMTAQTDHRAGNTRSAQANLAKGQVKNEEAYCHGKPGPDGVQHCYHCNAENHISRYCPKKAQEGMLATPPYPVGQAMLNVNSHEVPLNNVLHVPDANANLILVKALMNNGAHVIFDNQHATLALPDGTIVISDLNPQTRYYEFPELKHKALVVCTDERLSGLPEMFDDEAKAAKHSFTPDFMHKQCSHPGWNKARIIEKLYNIKLPGNECQDCVVRKSFKARMSKSNNACTKHLLELIHINLTTHLSTKTEFTCLLTLKEWIHYAKIQMGHKLKTLCLDNGGKWISAAAAGWQNEAGFWWQKTSAYTSEQNKYHAKCQQPSTLSHFYDRDPRKPFALLQTFGCLAWVNIPKAKCKKLDEPAIPAIFIGYDKEHKGWKFLAPSHNLLIFWSNSAHFLQDMSWNDCTDTTLIQDTDALHYKDMDDIKDLRYDKVDEHNEELQQPINNIYQPPLEPNTAFKNNIPIPRPTETIFEYLAVGIDNALETNPSTTPLD